MTRRKGPAFLTGIAAAAAILASCSSAAVDEAGADSKGRLGVSHTDEALVIENRTGRPVLAVRATIDGGSAGPFSIVIPTLEPGETKTVLFGLLRADDGTELDVAAVTPKAIALSAADTLNNRYDVSVPW